VDDARRAGAGDGRAELMLALLADARLPTGGHTQSAGLEPALRSGLDPARIPDYVAARLATVTRVEAATAVVARHVALTAGAHRAEQADGPADGLGATGALVRTWRAWAARTPSPALRETSQRLGRGYLRLLRQLWPGHPAVDALDAAARAAGCGERRGAPPPRPLVLGVTAACAGLSAHQVARLVGYEDVQTVTAATLKLEPVDPVVATAWVVAAQGRIDALAHEVAGLTDPRAIPAHGAPLVEQWAETHARTTERLFSA
jgi:urease accessory protein